MLSGQWITYLGNFAYKYKLSSVLTSNKAGTKLTFCNLLKQLNENQLTKIEMRFICFIIILNVCLGEHRLI